MMMMMMMMMQEEGSGKGTGNGRQQDITVKKLGLLLCIQKVLLSNTGPRVVVEVWNRTMNTVGIQQA
jgi:hypothetical protein